ncbi:type I polyketide synthase, partial [Nisaea nitritireducens]|uniref:type I polyketide synthase n=1 Tax=Nisaea nitritireducens TaxID=568392 RepID=UPI001868AD54
MKTVLITGGAGGLGRLVAKHLAKKEPVKLVLTGRSDPSEATAALLASLKAAGADAFYLQADICDHDGMASGLAEARRQFGPVTGVIHAAGLSGKTRLFEKSLEEFRGVLSPKIDGTQLLDKLLVDDPLEFVCYFSSTSAVLGDFGSCDYAVANRFLNAYASHRNERVRTGALNGRTIVIDWPLWRDGGMGFNDDGATEFYLKTSGQRLLEGEEGLQLLDQFITGEIEPSLVLAGVPRRLNRMLGLAETEDASGPHPGSENVPVSETSLALPKVEERRGLSGRALKKRVGHELRAVVSGLLKIHPDRLDGVSNFGDFGFDSISLSEFSGLLTSRFGFDVTPDVFFGAPTLNDLTAYLLEEHGAALEALFGASSEEGAAAPVPEGLAAPVEPVARPRPTVRAAVMDPVPGHEPIAIIGMSGRFPGARSVPELWGLLERGECAVGPALAGRFAGWDVGAEELVFGAVPGVDEFDPLFFEISPREAEGMDPRQRLLLQETWNALEDAGYGAERVASETIGTFIGVEEGDFQAVAPPEGAGISITSNHAGILAARLAYFLGLRGPAIAMNTACSSGLVALHQACQSLRLGECDSALAGGVSLMLTPGPILGMRAAGMLSPDGTCRAFA